MISSTLTDNRDITSLTSIFLYNEIPTVQFQNCGSRPNGHHLIKWALQLCQWSVCCRPLPFSDLQRNRIRYRIIINIYIYILFIFFSLRKLGVCKSIRSSLVEYGAVSSSPLHWRTACHNFLSRQTGGGAELEGICHNVPPREGKTALLFPK